MFSNWIKKLCKYVRQKYVGWTVRKGKLPYGITQTEVVEALKVTRPAGVLEIFGMLRMRIKRAATGLWEDAYPSRRR